MENRPRLERWSRHGLLAYPWSSFEAVNRLVLSPPLREQLLRQTSTFARGARAYHDLGLAWRRGLFLYGPSGSGKTAAGRAIALALNWDHRTIPAHEILDAHLFERALADTLDGGERVVVLEDVDQMVRRMEPEVFFTLLDHTLERAEGQFWVATSRRPEETPKTQLIRPGRFDEALHLTLPAAAVRRETLMSFLVPFFSAEAAGDAGIDEGAFADLVERTDGLSFAHLEELRQVCARLRLEGRDAEIWGAMHEYLGDQLIAGDRWGTLSDSRARVEERITQMDPRVMMAAIELTDVFRALMEKVIGDASERSRDNSGPELSGQA